MIYASPSVLESPAEQRRRRMWASILEEGLAIVEREGVDGLTIAKLAASVSLTPGALYRYAASKDALIAAMIAQVLGEWMAELTRAEARLSATGAPLVASLLPLRLYLRVGRRDRARFALVAATLADPRVLVADLREAVHLSSLLGLLARVESGLIGLGGVPGDGAALLLGLTGVMQARKLERAGEAPLAAGGAVERLAERLVWMSVLGLGVAPGALSEAWEQAGAVLNVNEEAG